jgi:hypothetical protein
MMKLDAETLNLPLPKLVISPSAFYRAPGKTRDVAE